MNRGPAFGLVLALTGTLVLTPDALLMRLSDMDGFQMTGWRGLFMGSMMIFAWAIMSKHRTQDLRYLLRPTGALIVAAQVGNSTLFCLGIATAPAAIVLMGVAAVPVFSAVLGRFVTQDLTPPATWITIGAVLFGLSVAVFGGGHGTFVLDMRLLAGAGFGLGVAFVLALNFVTLRAAPELPILLAIGLGAWIAGVVGWTVSGSNEMWNGAVWAMAVTGLFVLPVSFFMLSLAARYTLAANVSLLMLLETVLGPFWVWWGVGETPTTAMLVGGGIVVCSLASYLVYLRRNSLGS